MKKYTVDYFIKKFKAIPLKNWNVGGYVNEENESKMCALGHCGLRTWEYRRTKESVALAKLFLNLDFPVTSINDYSNSGYKQKTPKGRVLAALRDIKGKVSTKR